jgi:hypothetical protein
MRSKRTNERRGVILMVVLALLTLFAIIGITFVMYADSEATAARVAREAETQQRPDMEPEQALAFFLGQLIYDATDDVNGVGSGLRGHSLARTLYGYNYGATATPNIVPFNGVGRLHQAGGVDDYTLVNYTWFSTDPLMGGKLRDPERVGTRGGPVAPQNNPYVGGNAPYTYPDLNNFFLAAVKADGTVLVPSFHRPWLFNPGKAFNDMTNPNWTNAQGKYLTLRPRPQEHPTFPLPDDATGDVKNLVWAPGGNDSIWIDIGAPVMTAKDGTQYKMLVAPLIIDLDGRINLNTAGNVLGPGNTHVSNQGWGSWEVNLAKVLYGDNAAAPVEYIKLFTGNTLVAGNTVYGRYIPGASPVPSAAPFPTTIPYSPGAISLATLLQHSYAQSDFNGVNEGTPGTATPRPLLPGTGAPPNVNPPTNAFAVFLQGYLNGGTENQNHPLLYNIFRSPFYNGINTRVFRPSDMEALLRPNSLVSTSPIDSGNSALMSDLIRLCQANFGPSAASPRYRNLVTALNMDLGAPGVSPYWWSGMPATSYLTMNTIPILAPLATTPAPFPTLPPNPTIANTPGINPPTSEFGTDWRGLSANTATYVPTAYLAPPIPPSTTPISYTTPGGRILLNRPLPPYPHMGSGLMPPYQGLPPNTLSPYGTAYNLSNAAVNTQYQAALSARQALANDIYRRLLEITGVAPPANSAAPTANELAPRRWLAQLAVNIVDYIDEDDINTPFNFYTVADGLPAAQIGSVQPVPPAVSDDPGANTQDQSGTNATGANPTYWVFGTELPKVVLNEVLAEAQNSTPGLAPVANESVQVWAELYNTMLPTPGTNAQPQDSYRVPLYMTLPGGGGYSPYRISIVQYPMDAPNRPNPPPNPPTPSVLPDASANVLGKGYIAGPFPQSTTDADFSPTTLPNGAQLSQDQATPPPAPLVYQQPFTLPGTTNTVNAGVDPGNFFLIGPPPPAAGTPYQDPFVFPGLPQNIPVVRTTNMTYSPNNNNWWQAGTPPPPDERVTGLGVMLRRLANPYLPLQPIPGQPNYNPYITIDHIGSVPIRSQATDPGPAPSGYYSRGKRQPYASLTVTAAAGVHTTPQPNSPVMDQQPAAAVNNVFSTFGLQNAPLPASGHYDWLVHLDRAPISPMELMHVSGYQPYQLTQRFILPQPNTAGDDAPLPASAVNMFQHYVPWLDVPPAGPTAIQNMACPWWFDNSGLQAGQSHRLYRLFEFLECGDRAYGVNGLGRIPGKVNINTVWDAEILQALIDANQSIGLNAMPSQYPPNAADPIVQIFNNLLQSRSPTGVPGMTGVQGATDRPFLPLSVGLNPAGTMQFPTNGTAFSAIGTSATTDTVLRLNPSANTLLLFQNPADNATVHPYLQTQLLTKLYNNVTTRSNTFAVFLTVGFFQVIPGGAVGAPNIPQLGPEIGRAEGRQVRHRMFAIVDRTNLSVFSTTSSSIVLGPTPNAANPTAPNNPTGTAQITLTSGVAGVNPNTGVAWTITPGMQLVIEPGTANEETVVVQAVTGNQITANFLKQHPNPAITGNTSTTYTIIQRGNPGPWGSATLPGRYDPRLDPLVVPYFSIID